MTLPSIPSFLVLVLVLVLVLLAPHARSLSVATYNVLCADDEYNREWGCPLEISNCESKQSDCTRDRRLRVWEMLDGQSIDVLLLQEVEDGFLALKPPTSTYRLINRSGQCAILVRDTHRTTILDSFNLTVPDQTNCEFVPAVTITTSEGDENITLASTHVEASVSDMGAFYASLSSELSRLILSSYVIVGGDFNHNVSSAPPPPNYSISSAPTLLSNGTSQHQDDWMGSFDYFLHSSTLSTTLVEASTKGFMPKVVQGYQQGGVNRDLAQVRMENSS